MEVIRLVLFFSVCVCIHVWICEHTHMSVRACKDLRLELEVVVNFSLSTSLAQGFSVEPRLKDKAKLSSQLASELLCHHHQEYWDYR